MKAISYIEHLTLKDSSFLGLADIQSMLFSLLKEFDAFCKLHGLEYTLCGGTMLGAVRHKGFIPWDDDLDLMMLRTEYERLLALSDEVRLMPCRRLVTHRDGTFPHDFARFIRTDYARVESDSDMSGCLRFGIDIFPIDSVPSDDALFTRQVNDHRKWFAIMQTSDSAYGTGSTFARRLGKDVFRPVSRLIGGYTAAHRGEAICLRHANCQDGNIAIVCGMYGVKERWPLAKYHPIVDVEFNGGFFPAPMGYDLYLEGLFGDYMTPPPESERVSSHRLKVWQLDDPEDLPDSLAGHW